MRTWTIYCLLLVSLLVVAVAGCSAKTGKKTHFQQGLEYFDSEDYEGAAHEFELAVVENKANNDALFNQGLSYLKAGKYDRAVVTYDTYIQIDPKHAKAHMNLAHAYVGKEDLDSAKKYFEQAIALDETYAYPYSAYAQFLLRQETSAANVQAKELMLKATAMERKDSTAHYLLGVVQKRLGDDSAAEDSFSKAVDYDGENQPALVQLAHYELAVANFTDAGNHYVFAATLDPEDTSAFLGAGICYRELGHLNISLKSLWVAKELDMENADIDKELALTTLALAEMHIGDLAHDATDDQFFVEQLKRVKSLHASMRAQLKK